MEQKMIRLFEDKLSMIRNDIANEVRMREQSFAELNGCLESDLPKLSEKIRTEAANREEAD